MNATFSRSRFAAALLLPAALVSAAPQAPADDETYQGEAPERYAMVRTLEGEVRIRKGDLDERWCSSRCRRYRPRPWRPGWRRHKW